MTTARSLAGQVAWITGGGKGIGRAIALELAASGARVLVTGRDERALGETVGEIACAGGQARHLIGDVRREEDATAAVARAIETWGRLDVVVANAGLAGTTHLGGPWGDPNPPARGEGEDAGHRAGADGEGRNARARAIMETNLMGTFFSFDAALAGMKGAGRLIAVSSVLGKFGAPGQAAYCASKAGLHGLVRALAIDVGPRRITCNAVCPGWVDTEMARGRIRDIALGKGEDPRETLREAKEALPLGRFVEPEEVARLVSFLCSPAADVITGQALSICAGTTVFAG